MNKINSKPLNRIYTKREEMILRTVWNKKLKDSGFKDIEMWDSFDKRKTQRIQFIRSHIRWSHYKTKQKFLEQGDNLSNYFRVLGLYAHHGPIKEKYKEIVILYTELGSIPKSLQALNSNIQQRAIQKYLVTNMPKMLKFVNEEFGND